MSYDVTGATLRVMTHIPPPAVELGILDAELRQLDTRRAQLLHRRAWLLTVLQQDRPAPVLSPPPTAPPRREATAPSVQNVLLLLGATLLTLAAIAFTLVSWGSMGIAGRALVLGAVTLATLGAPVALLRRGLRSTAESLAGLGLALTVLDAYALHEVAFPTGDGVTFAAAAATALTAVWTAYGIGLTALPSPPNSRTEQTKQAGVTHPADVAAHPNPTGPRPDPAGLAAPPSPPNTRADRPSPTLLLPLPAALAIAQLPLLLWAIAAGGGPHTITVAILLTAVIDMVLALRVSPKAVRLVAAGGAYAMGGWGVLAAGQLSLDAAGPGAAARAAALFALAAAGAFGAAWLASDAGLRTRTAAAGGLFVVVALGGMVRATVPADWTVPGYLACGIALLALVRGRLPEPVRHGLGWASGAVQAGAVLWALPLVGVTLLGPGAWLSRVWSGAPDNARDAAATGAFWPAHPAATPLVLAAVAAVLAMTMSNPEWRPRARTAALTLTWATALTIPTALQLPYTIGLLTQDLTIIALLALTHRTATVLALVTSLSLAALSLATEPATLSVLASLTAVFAVAAWRGRLAPASAAASLGYATVLACATGAALNWQPQHIALLALAVPVTAALLAPRISDPSTTLAVEITGAVAALVAIGLSTLELPMFALVLALCGVIAAGTAVRPDRRNVGYAAAVLFVLATWVRLSAWDVGSPEAYTLPVTVPALLVGALRRRRDPGVSSWTAYGPGLAATLAPSLLAAWSDAHWTRPLLLGTAALLVTLIGARHRLQAPLTLGGATLVLDALHELAPYLAQVVGALPRWAPPALAGLLLLALGATYEQRIRDARRVRDVLGRMN
ncbi:SCO7613 C-terminal domain-containing membrane protein [Streptomyces sp. NPDC050528]|uniref:SCO7613 C-terminal domain-containing membrane protein n=1 Tax=Streptomyces sp. NPDC050528 TaxID=3365623 RepID=UPI0037BB8454